MDIEEIRNVPSEYKQLIERFCTQHRAVKLFVDSQDGASANNSYLEMVDIYSKIAKSDLAPIHKKIAYAALTETYDRVSSLSAPVVSSNSIRLMVSVAVLLVVVMAVITLKPGIVGLVTLDAGQVVDAPFWVHPSRLIEITKTTTIDLDDYVVNPSGRPITYLASKGDRVDVSLYEHYLTLIPHRLFAGRDSITIIAADSQDPDSFVRVPVTIKVSPQLLR